MRTSAVRSLNQRHGRLELPALRNCPISSFENVGFEYRAHYEQNPKQNRQWSENHSAPPILIEEITVSERSETEPNRSYPKGDENDAVQWSLRVWVKHFVLQSAAANLQPAKELSHALQSTVEFGYRSGIGDADVLLRAKAFPWNGGDVHLA